MGIPETIQLANLGMADSLILMVLALVVFGPRRLPQIGRQIGKLMYEFRKASNDFKFQMEEELRNAEEADRRKKEEERLRTLALNAPAPESPASETSTAEATAENPYPWDSVYPSVSDGESATETTAETATETTSEAGAETPKPDDSAPRLQPPSTGETVAAMPPSHPRRKRAVKPAATPEGAAEAPKPDDSAPRLQPPSSGEAAAAAPSRPRRKRAVKPAATPETAVSPSSPSELVASPARDLVPTAPIPPADRASAFEPPPAPSAEPAPPVSVTSSDIPEQANHG